MGGLHRESVSVPLPGKEVAARVAEDLWVEGVRYGETHSTLLVPRGLVREVMERGGAYAQSQRTELPLDDESLQEIEISHPRIYDSIIRELSDRRVPFIKDNGALTIRYSESNLEVVREVVGRYVQEQYKDLDAFYKRVFASLERDRHGAAGASVEQVEIPRLDKDGKPVLPKPALIFDMEEALRRQEDRQRSFEMNAMRADAPWPKTDEELREQRAAEDLKILFSSAHS